MNPDEEETAMPKPTADRDTCEGYGNCVVAAPDVYDIDDEGKVVLLAETVPDAERSALEEAVRGCPVNALAIED
jgi:3-phenylpropionate/trans-cinnamate dioxygenase ferredoxin reductase subunit